ncbi:hypothetical protein R1sor_013145 [Riccia sorocarpa]|uniref:RRM domain-containing protein n=1 Tax=Riccia sorocarpa TaxID=122646 RepID=A0ABD3H7P3_9MARC
MDQNKGETGKVRLFVGGLSSSISSVDLKERFAPLGTVLTVSTPQAKDEEPGPHRGFAYVDFLPSSDASLRKLFSAVRYDNFPTNLLYVSFSCYVTVSEDLFMIKICYYSTDQYNGCKWRGGVLRIEVAKEHYTEKLKKEWAAEAEAEALAAKEAEELQKKNAVPDISPAKQAKAWPLLLLEKPEIPDKFKRKRDFEQGAVTDGIKIFFPRLKKVRTVPLTGSGKHKRSFQRVEGLPLQQLSTCDCDTSLRTGSCDCSSNKLGNIVNNLAKNSEDDPISMAIANERQRQLDLLERLFPSDSPRKSKTAKVVSASAAHNKDEVKEAPSSGPGKDEKNQAKGHDSEGQASRVDSIFSDMETDRDSRKLILPEIKGDVSRAAQETVNPEVITPVDASPSLQHKVKDAEVEADDPEMWVSFMDTMPLPAKTEETVSEIELDELSMMLSEGEDESEDGEEEEAEKAVPDTPKKKAKRKKKKKGKKSKQSAKSDPENEHANKKLETAQSGAHSTAAVDSPLGADGEVSVPASEKSPVAEMNIVENGPLQTRGLEENDGVLQEDNNDPQELKALVNGKGEESSDDEMDSSDKESDDVFPLADDRGEFYAGVSSSDESFDAQSDEAELWISGIDEVQNADGMGSRSASAVSKEKKLSKDNDASLSSDEASEDGEDSYMYIASDGSMESDDDEPENSLSSSEPSEEGETSDEADSESQEEQPELWVSGLESITSSMSPQTGNKGSKPDAAGASVPTTSTPLQKTKEGSKSDTAKVSGSVREANEEPSRTGVSSLTASANADEVLVKKTQEDKGQEESNPAAVASSIPKSGEEVENGPPATDSSAPKRNELTRATWKSLVGETGRVVFSLQQVLGGKSSGTTPATDELPATPQPEAQADSVNFAGEENVSSFGTSITQDDARTKSVTKVDFKSWQEFPEVDAPPQLPVFTDSSVCPFMKSPDAEEEWLASKSELRSDYRVKHKQAVKKSRKLRGR